MLMYYELVIILRIRMFFNLAKNLETVVYLLRARSMHNITHTVGNPAGAQEQYSIFTLDSRRSTINQQPITLTHTCVCSKIHVDQPTLVCGYFEFHCPQFESASVKDEVHTVACLSGRLFLQPSRSRFQRC